MPCVKLRNQTLADPKVVKALEGVEVIFVDLDEYPGLAKTYGVSSIPDVFFIDSDGMVTDRLKEFEEPAQFAKRVAAWRGKTKTATLGATTSVPSEEVVKELGLAHNVRVLGRLVVTVE